MQHSGGACRRGDGQLSNPCVTTAAVNQYGSDAIMIPNSLFLTLDVAIQHAIASLTNSHRDADSDFLNCRLERAETGFVEA